MRFVQEPRGYAIAALALTLLAAAPYALAQELPAPDAPWRAAENFDLNYLNDALDQEYFATEVLLLCATRPVHDEMEAACQDWRSSLAESTLQLQNWLDQWYGRGHTPELTGEQLNEIAALEALADGQFEREFLHSLLRIHDDGIKAAMPCREGAEHEELQNLCNAAAEEWRLRSVLLRDWLCTWYDDCGAGPVATDVATWGSLKALYE